MRKYLLDLKVEVVESVLKEGHSFKSASQKYGMCPSDVQKWVNAYEHHGIEGLMVKNGSYSGDFRVHVVEYKHAKGLSARKTAALFNIPTFKSVLDWERIYEERGADHLREEMRGRTQGMKKRKPYQASQNAKNTADKELLKENEYLRMENDYLKKLYALIQEEKTTTKPKQ